MWVKAVQPLYDRVKGKTCQHNHVEFGECVSGLKPDSNYKAKADVRWLNGVYLGTRDMTYAFVIGTPEGVINLHTISRKVTMDQQWGNEEMLKHKGSPMGTNPM